MAVIEVQRPFQVFADRTAIVLLSCQPVPLLLSNPVSQLKFVTD